MSGSYDPALRSVLVPLGDDLRGLLGDDLVGLYLYGSVVVGGYDPGVSDLDLVAVTRRGVEQLDLAALDRVHHKVVARDPCWLDRLDIVYVAQSTVAGSIGQDSVAVISPGESFHVTGPASDWLQNWSERWRPGAVATGRPSPVSWSGMSGRSLLLNTATCAA